MSEKRYTVHVVPETHWDREWYTEFQGFRRKLIKLTDKLLDILDSDPEYKYYIFDGQTVVLEDYLEIRPENQARIAKHVQSGRLQVGPWYCLPDEWLVSAEGLVRNLLLGHKVAESFGRVMKAGYIPDPFGHGSQLPQILAGFGIDSVFFMRGVGDREWIDANEKTEFWWEAPDGTKALGVFLKNSYCNAMNLGYGGMFAVAAGSVAMDAAAEHSRGQIDSLGPFATTRHILFNNGCDHIEPQPELAAIIAHLNEVIEDAEFVHSTYEDYARLVKEAKPDLGTVAGEFAGAKFWQLLSGTLSARVYLKLANEKCQALLERYAEPLQALAWLEGGTYEESFLWHAWRFVLKNHPHDSICGCSTDQTHREMVPRFAQAEQIGEMMAKEATDVIAGKLAVKMPEGDAAPYGRMVVVFNPSSWARREMVVLKTAAALRPHMLPPAIVVRDSEGNAVPSQIVKSKISEYDASIGMPADQVKWSFGLAFLADVPAMGFRAYSAAPGEAQAFATDLRAGADWIENEVLQVNVALDGSVFVTDKRDGSEYGPLNIFEDQEDAGDEYDWGYATSGRTVSSMGQQAVVSLVDSGPARATLRIDRRMVVPKELTADRQRRSEETVEVPITTYVWLTSGSARVEFKTKIDNTARDHRLRALFHVPVEVDRCFAMGHFDVMERMLAMPEAVGWVQKPQPTKPVKGFVDVADGEMGLGVVMYGLNEYEVKDAEEGKIVALTLVRACGWLSRDDYALRPYNAGPKLETPEAQCLGEQWFRYAVVPHEGTWLDADLWHHAEAVRAPLRAAEYPLVEREGEGQISFFEVTPATMVVTAVKKAERSDELVVRLLNIDAKEGEATLTFYKAVASAKIANLNEEAVGDAKVEGNVVKVKARAKEIVTLLITLA